MGTLYMIRHGQASFGQADYDRLSPLGLRQARSIARHFYACDARFDAVYSGCKKRQIDTAAELIDYYRVKGRPLPEVVCDPAFDEYDHQRVWEVHSPAALKGSARLKKDLEAVRTDANAFQEVFSKVILRWISGAHDPPDLMTWEEFRNRVQTGLFDLFDRLGPGKRVAVFTSVGSISVALQAALGIPAEKTAELSWQVMNASISRFTYASRRLTLTGFNEVSHLERNQEPGLLSYR